MAKRWKNRPEGSNWGDFGPDDEIGRLNLITPERRLAAIAEVKEGIAFCLSLPLDLPGGTVLTPLRKPPVRGVVPRDADHDFVNFPMRLENDHWDDISSDDYVTLYTQYSTQWDAFSHVGRYFDANGDGEAEAIYYNGFRAGIDVIGSKDPGGPTAKRLGIEKMAETCVQGRGVLIDLNHYFGAERRLVNFDDLCPNTWRGTMSWSKPATCSASIQGTVKELWTCTGSRPRNCSIGNTRFSTVATSVYSTGSTGPESRSSSLTILRLKAFLMRTGQAMPTTTVFRYTRNASSTSAFISARSGI